MEIREKWGVKPDWQYLTFYANQQNIKLGFFTYNTTEGVYTDQNGASLNYVGGAAMLYKDEVDPDLEVKFEVGSLTTGNTLQKDWDSSHIYSTDLFSSGDTIYHYFQIAFRNSGGNNIEIKIDGKTVVSEVIVNEIQYANYFSLGSDFTDTITFLNIKLSDTASQLLNGMKIIFRIISPLLVATDIPLGSPYD